MAGTISVVASAGGMTIQETITKLADNTNVYGAPDAPISLTAATAMLTYLRDEDAGDDTDTGTGTLTPGHGLTTGVYDLYWADGVRYGVTCTITTNDIDITASGAGDFLPDDDTVVNMSKQVQINTSIDGDVVAMLVINASKRSHIDFFDVGDVSIDAFELLADQPYIWHDSNGITNPFTGNPITYAMVSNGDTSAASVFRIIVMQDSTP